MSEIKVNNIQSLSGTNGPEMVSGITTMASSGAMSLPRGDTAYRGGRGRGIFGGGYGASSPWIQILTQLIILPLQLLGNAKDFGDLVQSSNVSGASCAVQQEVYFCRWITWSNKH